MSLNYWFQHPEPLRPPPGDLPPHYVLDLGRQVEALAAAAYGPRNVAAFCAALAADVAGGDGADDRPADAVGCANFVVGRLADLLGPAGVRPFVETHLAVDRFVADAPHPAAVR